MKLRKRGYVGTTSTDVTEREVKNAALVRRAAAEGFVLLKNEGGLLPLKKGSRIGLYGAGAVRTVKGGTGSGDVNNRASVNIAEGLIAAGFDVTKPGLDWLAAYEDCYRKARESWKAGILRKVEEGMDFFTAYSTSPFAVPCGDPVDEAAARTDGADTAIFVMSRIAGENADRHDTPGDYYVSGEARKLLR
ncbi:MAG: glycoside hydrolase family 3 C-terminal domain-containing protein, partial [Clostridiales bacterium]|nr:glycoside hydrolase family 3 C-terminal domain-containing protein [Clostridiales bacterium]